MSPAKLKYFLVGLAFLLLQIFLIRHLAFFGLKPDLVLLYILWIMMHQDRTTCILTAAALAFCQDALLDLWGLHMFSKTAVAFFAYRFVPRVHEYRLLIWQAFLLLIAIALFHNIILLSLSFFIEAYTIESFWVMAFGNTIYTAVIGTLFYLFKN